MPIRRGSFWQVGDILDRFVVLGCTVREAEPTVQFEEGDVLNVRYLLNASSGGFAALQDLADDDRVSTEEVRFWERRLGLAVLSELD